MKKTIKIILTKIVFILNIAGFDPYKFISAFSGLTFYIKDYYLLKKQSIIKNDFVFGKFYPILNERFSDSGNIKGHYFHQDLLIARKIYENNPSRHIDIGSRIDGFVAHVASFREIEVFDIRPLISPVRNIIFTQADLMKLPNELLECCDSLSSLHAIEHFGLGRYGDPICIDGHLKAIDNLYKMLKPRGKFYFAVPIGNQRIEFNAHRVFCIKYLLQILDNKFKIEYFHYVNDEGNLIENAVLAEDSIAMNFNCTYGCGIFELTKN
jgi:SAM-dependent methyltransferase